MCAMQVFDIMQTIKLVRERFKATEVELLGERNYAILARIAGLLDDKVKVTTFKEVRVADIVTEKYYYSYDIAHVLMPGLAGYLN